jgi:hypothetical protein
MRVFPANFALRAMPLLPIMREDLIIHLTVLDSYGFVQPFFSFMFFPLK